MFRIGLIGCGNISETFTQGVRESPDLTLQAVCSASEESMNTVGDRENISRERRFKDYRDLLKSEDIDAVVICTPNNLHYQMAIDAIYNKKPFILEKPITVSLESAEKLLKITEESNILNSVNYSYRFYSTVRYIKYLIEKGELGRVYHMYVQFFQGWASNPEKIMLKRRSWRLNKEISGSGVLGDLGTHVIDLTRFLIGEFNEVSADMGTFIEKRMGEERDSIDVDVDDYVNIFADLEGGVKANYGLTRYASGRGNFLRVEIYGEKGSLIYKHNETDDLKICIGEKNLELNKFRVKTIPTEFEISRMQSFADLLKGNKDNLNPTIRDGYETQLVVKAIFDAAISGRKEFIVK
jgi:predicted dehydrogenase